jgi:hypothetical protein
MAEVKLHSSAIKYPIETEISVTQEILIGLCEMQGRTPTLITERIIIQAYTLLNELVKEIDPSHNMHHIDEKAKGLARRPTYVHQYLNFLPHSTLQH